MLPQNDMSDRDAFSRILLGLTVYFMVSHQPVYAAPACIDFFSGKREATPIGTLNSLLSERHVNGNEIIDFLSRDPRYKVLFESPAGVWEGYSIKEHTLMVYAVFAKQFPAFHRAFQFRANPNVRLLQTLKLAIALHDIGKPYAIRAKDKTRQHEFTIPMVEKAFAHFGFSHAEIRLAKALIGNDILGGVVRGRVGPGEAKRQLTEQAKLAGMSLVEYAPLQFLFYTIDAASYPSLRRRVFTSRDGLLFPNQGQFQRLWSLIEES